MYTCPHTYPILIYCATQPCQEQSQQICEDLLYPKELRRLHREEARGQGPRSLRLVGGGRRSQRSSKHPLLADDVTTAHDRQDPFSLSDHINQRTDHVLAADCA